ncbi:MAG: PDZ domain-containing protein [Planctomycetota bacterium]
MIRFFVSAILLGSMSIPTLAQVVDDHYAEQEIVFNQFNHAAVVRAMTGDNGASCQSCHTPVSAISYVSDLHELPRYVYGLRNDGSFRVGSYFVAPLIDQLFRSHLPIDDEPAFVVTESSGPSEDGTGLMKGDVLLSFNDTQVDNVAKMKEVIEASRDKMIDIELVRKGKKQSVEMEANSLTAPLPPFRIGVQIESPSEALRAQLNLYNNEGLLVVALVDDSPAIEAGVKVHDVLLRADGQRLSDNKGLSGIVNSTQGKALTLTVMRSGKEVELEVTPVRAPESEVVRLDYCPSFQLHNPHRVEEQRR